MKNELEIAKNIFPYDRWMKSAFLKGVSYAEKNLIDIIRKHRLDFLMCKTEEDFQNIVEQIQKQLED